MGIGREQDPDIGLGGTSTVISSSSLNQENVVSFFTLASYSVKIWQGLWFDTLISTSQSLLIVVLHLPCRQGSLCSHRSHGKTGILRSEGLREPEKCNGLISENWPQSTNNTEILGICVASQTLFSDVLFSLELSLF